MEEEKIVDLDGAFDKRVAEYLSKKKGKFSEEEWEDKISDFYKAYGNSRIESLGATPNEYYQKMSAPVLSRVVKEHFRRDVPVDGFLRRALEENKNRSVLLELLKGNEEEAAFAVELLGNAKEAKEEYFSLLSGDISEDLAAKISEILAEDGEENKSIALKLYKIGKRKDVALDLLSRTLPPDDEVFFVLVDAFEKGYPSIGVAAARLGAYGDERALEYIYRKGEKGKAGYLDWREMQAAAQMLGGNLEDRDFSRDKDFIALKKEEEKRAIERENRLRGE